ncbi:Mur ligase domain-containing protein, partial [Candidatus Parcubacteria bacterium]|nr:Mur ligase domain-containing protein [Candidatus Parcubacteria bacterium]
MPSLTKYKRIHFVGIKGIGVSALATIAKKMGFEVTGSDVATVFISDVLLKEAGIPVKDFAAGNIEGVEAVVHSVAYGEDHVEIAAARRKGLPLYTYPQALGELMTDHIGVSVTGCNGKTTTTSMIS